MKHGKKFNHLSRPAAHRRALLVNLAKELILHKRISTTLAKAKALRKFVEPILTKGKNDTTHARRVVFSYFQDKVPVKELFNNIVPKIEDRPGGYTRIIRLGSRLGDNTEMCMMELVDYNELFQKVTKPEKAKTRRGKSKAKAIAQKGEIQTPAQEKAVAASTPKASTQGMEDQDNALKAAKKSQLSPKAQDASISEVSKEETLDVEENV